MQSLFLIVKHRIDEWNPFQLLPEAPSDEFDSESREITDRLNCNMSTEEIASLISEIFSRTFGENFSLTCCYPTAQKIAADLQQSKI